MVQSRTDAWAERTRLKREDYPEYVRRYLSPATTAHSAPPVQPESPSNTSPKAPAALSLWKKAYAEIQADADQAPLPTSNARRATKKNKAMWRSSMRRGDAQPDAGGRRPADVPLP